MLYEGLVTLPPMEKISKKGKAYAKFVIQDSKQAVLQVVVFGSSVKQALSELQPGTKVVIDGEIDSSPLNSSSVPTIKGSGFRVGDSKGKKGSTSKASTPSHGINSSDSLQHRETMERQGYVRVRIDTGRYEWKPKARCLMVDNEWVDPMSFAIDILGAELVNKLCRGEDYSLKGLVGLARLESKKEVQWGLDVA